MHIGCTNQANFYDEDFARFPILLKSSTVDMAKLTNTDNHAPSKSTEASRKLQSCRVVRIGYLTGAELR